MIPVTEIRVLLRTLSYLDFHTEEEEKAVSVLAAWVNTQPAAEWKPCADGEYNAGQRHILVLEENGRRLGLIYDDDAIAVVLPDNRRLCELVLAEAEAT